MKDVKRFVKVGDLPTGEKNNICDVPGVKVGHYTLNNETHHTGLTAILPHDGNMFRKKVEGGSFAFNGFGKSVGLMQIDELGTIETPIILTNTLNVGGVSDGLVKYMLANNKEICTTCGTVNPVVMECNDGKLNNIREILFGEKEVLNVIASAKDDFTQGSVGAGTGMICNGLKGGIGSSSRRITINANDYTVGVLVNSNFGQSNSKALIFNGRPIGEDIYRINQSKNEYDKGSIIVVVATDVPLDGRQLRRVAKRAALGIARTGSYAGNGSGDVFVSFSTANITNHFEENSTRQIEVLKDDYIEKVFKATVLATEEAILNSMLFSPTVKGYLGEAKSINEYRELFEDMLINE